MRNTIELDAVECLVKKQHFVSDEYINICTGETTVIPYTNFELTVMVFMFVLTIVVCFMVYKIIFDKLKN